MRIDFPKSENIPDLKELWTESFGDAPFWEIFLKSCFSTDHCRCVFSEGKTVAALYWFDCYLGNQQVAYIYAVATEPAFRGRGLCRQLLEDTHNLLGALGYSSAMLVPEGERLALMYGKLGYVPCTCVREFTCEAGEEAVPLRRILWEEYGRLRRERLDAGSVIQEGDNLRHLANMAELWAGENILLAAYSDGDTLRVQEYLGDPAAAPDITKTLGCSRGLFRMPGGEKPFAMFYKLREDAAMPTYFGLAFD